MSTSQIPPSSIDSKNTLRTMQVAAIFALLVIGAIIYTFTHVTSPLEAGTALPVIKTTEAYRQKVPHFEWHSGKASLKTQDFLGGWTLLTFWSITCRPCLQEIPALDHFTKGWSGPALSVLSVNLDPSSPDVAQFLTDNQIEFSVLYDTKEELKTIFGVNEIPRHFLISPKGEIVWQAMGAYNWSAPESTHSLLAIMERENEPAEAHDTK